MQSIRLPQPVSTINDLNSGRIVAYQRRFRVDTRSQTRQGAAATTKWDHTFLTKSNSEWILVCPPLGKVRLALKQPMATTRSAAQPQESHRPQLYPHIVLSHRRRSLKVTPSLASASQRGIQTRHHYRHYHRSEHMVPMVRPASMYLFESRPIKFWCEITVCTAHVPETRITVALDSGAGCCTALQLRNDFIWSPCSA